MIDVFKALFSPFPGSILIGKAKNKLIKKQQKAKAAPQSTKTGEESVPNEQVIAGGNGHFEVEVELIEAEEKPTTNGHANGLIKAGSVEHPKLMETKQVNVSNNNSTSRPLTTPPLHKDTKSIFKLSSNSNKTLLNKLEDCWSLFQILYIDNDIVKNRDMIDEFKYDKITRESLNLCLYLNRAATLKLVNYEQNELKNAQSDKAYIFDVWKGDLAKLVEHLDEQENLNDFLINLYQLSRGSSEDTRALIDRQIERLVSPAKISDSAGPCCPTLVN